MTTLSAQQPWKLIENHIQEGNLKCYSQSDIDKSHMAVIAAGGWGVIYKGTIETSGEHVAIKKLLSYKCETTVKKMLVKEVGADFFSVHFLLHINFIIYIYN